MSHYSEANPLMGAVANEVSGHGGGKTYPGAVVPFGMVQLSPDTITGGDNGSGYSYGHPTIEGFSFVHMSGVGWYGEFGNLQTMPISGPRRYFSGTNRYTVSPIGETGWASHFDHDTEIARPGFYSVRLTDYDILAEAAAARHTGALRFSFAKGGENHIAIDLHRRIGGHSNEQFLRVADRQTLEGRILCTPEGGGWGHGDGHAHYEIHFFARLSRPMTSWCFFEKGVIFENAPEMHGTSLGFIADFDLPENAQIELHAAISFVDLPGAKNNFRTEDAPFDVLVSRAEAEWTRALGLIDIEGGQARDREVFYSSLYHTLLDPRDFSDCDGRCRAAMREPFRAEGYTFRTIFSGWDVYRSAFPLYTIVRPDVVRDEIRSLMTLSALHGDSLFPRWEIVGFESGCMVGDPGSNILADAFMKSLPGFDAERAYAIVRRRWLEDPADSDLSSFTRLGYVPGDVSKTMEYSCTAWALSRMAGKLGFASDAARFARLAGNYEHLLNPETGWPNRRDESGAFMPFSSKLDQGGCVESNVWQQTWFVPHDIPALRSFMGEDRFDRELDDFFAQADLSAFWNDAYNHSNEPVHTVPHLFTLTGRPEKTQYWVRRIQRESYRPGPYGYCGNEDVGQMSAWFVLTAVGLHQTCPGNNRFDLNTPLFPRAVLRLDPAFHACTVSRTLTSSTDSDPESHPFISGVELNGQPLSRLFLTWDELSAGGTLLFRLSKKPSTFGK